MKAMVLNRLGSLKENPAPLTLQDVPEPEPLPGEVLLRVFTCGVCHTELDEIEGRTPPPRLPVILGHQAVGEVVGHGDGERHLQTGQRVGVAWIHSACGECDHCHRGEENLCAAFTATGRDHDGGYAEYMTVPAAYAFPIPDVFDHAEAAPLLCAGAIGYRSLRLCDHQDGQRLGLTGFGASAHLVLKMARHRFPNSEVFVFARSVKERSFALELGAAWAGDTGDTPPAQLHQIIDTTPVWKPVLAAMAALAPGGRLVINAIRKEATDREQLLNLSYPEHLWMEKEIKSVANVARRDVAEFLQLAADMGIRPEVQEYELAQANQALLELKQGKIRGGKVLRMG